jgi:hypothetical protein
LETLGKFAQVMDMTIIDVITFPKKMVAEGEDTSMEAILQLRLSKEKKDEVLKIVFGESNLDVLK